MTIMTTLYLQADENMILGQFVEEGALVNVFPESENDTDEMGSCILITSRHVVLIKQRYKCGCQHYCTYVFLQYDC